jgi:hypothetical protein
MIDWESWAEYYVIGILDQRAYNKTMRMYRKMSDTVYTKMIDELSHH